MNKPFMVHPYEASCFTAATPTVSASGAAGATAAGTEGFGLVGAAFALALCFGGALEVASYNQSSKPWRPASRAASKPAWKLA